MRELAAAPEGVVIVKELACRLRNLRCCDPRGACRFACTVAARAANTPIAIFLDEVQYLADEGFFRVRLARLTSREKDYLRARAELGTGPHASGEIAAPLGIPVTAAGPLRNGLMQKGMIYSPKHGETAFTVPLFDAFMRRSIPDWKPAKAQGKQRGRSAR